MKIEVKVVAGARKNLIQAGEEGLKVYVTAPAVDGKANKALCDLLARHYKVRVGQIEIIKGLQSRRKIVNIENI